MRALPIDFAAYHRARRRARALTVPFVVVGVLLGSAVVRGLTGEGGPNPFALIPFLMLAGHAALAWRVLAPAWRRSFDARPVVQSLDPTPGETYGIPELDEPPGRHRGLAGEWEPPVRW